MGINLPRTACFVASPLLIAAAAARAGCDEVVTFDHRAARKLDWRLA